MASSPLGLKGSSPVHSVRARARPRPLLCRPPLLVAMLPAVGRGGGVGVGGGGWVRGGNGGGGGVLIACAQQASPVAARRFVACGGSSPSLFAGPPLSLARPRAALAHSARTPRSPLVHCPRRRRRCTALCSLRRFSHLRAAGQPRASRSGVPPERAATRPSGGRERKIRCQHFEIDLEVFFLWGGDHRKDGRLFIQCQS